VTRPNVLVITGPTAAGKSEIALTIAREYDAVLLSSDAMQVYIGMNIGTASPSEFDLASTPHFGVNVVTPEQPFSAADFSELGQEVLAKHPRVIVAGGTSLYLRALTRGLVKTPPSSPQLRAELETQQDLHDRLRELDPALAERLHPNDRLRIIRGLEVVLSGGVPLSTLHAQHASQPDRVNAVGLWVDRENLYDRIDARVLSMMTAGYLDEVHQLLSAGYHRALKPMQSLGYRHLCEHILDELPLEEAVRRTQRDTRQFSRKQRNWMKQIGYPRVLNDRLAEARRAADRVFQGK